MISGAMQLTLTLCGPACAATSCVRIWIPALAAAYAIGEPGWARRAAADEMVMIVPAFRDFIPDKKLLMVRNVAVRFASTVARHVASVMDSIGVGGDGLPPALATSTSTGPNRSSTSWRNASIAAKFVRS